MEEQTRPAEVPCLPGGLVSMDQWALPEASVRRSVMGAVRHVLDQLRAGMSTEETSFQSLDDLPELSARQRKQFAPEPDFLLQAKALEEYLDQARSQSQSQSRSLSSATSVPVLHDAAFLVAPPFSGLREMLREFPRVRDSGHTHSSDAWSVIHPPENLLLDEQQASLWWDQQDLSDGWVIPELADFWLRYVSGAGVAAKDLDRSNRAGGCWMLQLVLAILGQLFPGCTAHAAGTGGAQC